MRLHQGYQEDTLLPLALSTVFADVPDPRIETANKRHRVVDILTSLRVSTAELAGYIRAHRGIENGLHWCLDIAFREDQSRTRVGHAALNLGIPAVSHIFATL